MKQRWRAALRSVPVICVMEKKTSELTHIFHARSLIVLDIPSLETYT
ncbi:MAG: hypothetical protein GY702_01985 [Desulfobulbaceae bacterium]|nr:hypothetical protein [Desulfobulbaceae bacterium]